VPQEVVELSTNPLDDIWLLQPEIERALNLIKVENASNISISVTYLVTV
jgi:hypothetical protein